jgi:hypothetical protein
MKVVQMFWGQLLPVLLKLGGQGRVLLMLMKRTEVLCF